DDLVGRAGHDHGAQPHRPAGVRATAHAGDVGVAGDDPHALDADLEPLRDELGEAGLVALPRRQRADHHVDLTVGLHRDLGALAGDAGVQLDVVGEADPTTAATPPRLRASGLEAGPVSQRDRAVLGGRV